MMTKSFCAATAHITAPAASSGGFELVALDLAAKADIRQASRATDVPGVKNSLSIVC